MAAVSATPADRARKGAQLAFQALQEPGKASAIAVCMGMSDATVSRIKNERMEEGLLLLAHLGLKVVPAANRCVSAETFDFLTAAFVRDFEMMRSPVVPVFLLFFFAIGVT
jgi:hypothetical protein